MSERIYDVCGQKYTIQQMADLNGKSRTWASKMLRLYLHGLVKGQDLLNGTAMYSKKLEDKVKNQAYKGGNDEYNQLSDKDKPIPDDIPNHTKLDAKFSPVY